MTESKFDYRKILSKYSIVLVLIVIMIACTFANSSFLTANNLINVCRQQSVIIILAFGEMILIICGQLDLSCGEHGTCLYRSNRCIRSSQLLERSDGH